MIIFVHDNGNLNVLAMPKCGHTAMWDYFDLHHLRMTRTFAHWLEFTSQKVVVLRHPAKRMHSAIEFYNRRWNIPILEYQKNGIETELHLFKHFIEDPLEVEKYIFDQHCRPYMHIIKSRDFRIIKFEEHRKPSKHGLYCLIIFRPEHSPGYKMKNIRQNIRQNCPGQ